MFLQPKDSNPMGRCARMELQKRIRRGAASVNIRAKLCFGGNPIQQRHRVISIRFENQGILLRQGKLCRFAPPQSGKAAPPPQWPAPEAHKVWNAKCFAKMRKKSVPSKFSNLIRKFLFCSSNFQHPNLSQSTPFSAEVQVPRHAFMAGQVGLFGSTL